MTDIIQKINSIDWHQITEAMHQNGYAHIPGFLPEKECEILKSGYHQPIYRKTVVMARHRFGLGEYKYFNYPLPELIQTIRTYIYPHLVPIANSWFKALQIDRIFPERHEEFLKQCHHNGQHKATALILKYGKGGFNTLHQDFCTFQFRSYLCWMNRRKILQAENLSSRNKFQEPSQRQWSYSPKKEMPLFLPRISNPKRDSEGITG